MNSEHEDLIIDYLLGRMPSQQREVFDERMIAEPDLVEQTEAMEDELIRDALLGALLPDDQSRFDQCFLTYPHLRRKYELTRAMLIARGGDAASLRTAPPPVPVPARQSARVLGSWKLCLVAATVAAVILAWQDLRLRSHLQQLASARPAPGPPPSFLLQPGLERRHAPGSAGGAPNALLIPADAGAVRLQLEFEAAGRSGAYTVVVNAVDRNEQAWGREGLSASPAGATQTVTAEIPGSSLPPGDYTILLQASGQATVVETYSFRVSREPAR